MNEEELLDRIELLECERNEAVAESASYDKQILDLIANFADIKEERDRLREEVRQLTRDKVRLEMQLENTYTSQSSDWNKTFYDLSLSPTPKSLLFRTNESVESDPQ